MAEIDVIMPTYNQCDYLHRSITHILSQTFQDFCFIIVNDGSKDETKNILTKYEKNDKIKIIHNDKNKGLPASLNIGHAAGNSPYCTWVSTDNISFPDQFEKLYHKITKDNLDFVQSPWVAEIEKTGQIFYQDVRKIKSNWGMGTIGGSFLYKRIVWETYKYDEELQYVEDLKFYLQAFLHPFKFGHVEENLMKYYVQSNSLSGREDMSKHQALMDKIYQDVIKPKMEKK
jgi:glycosyltransferase involved in cell wall biosynthesis